MSGRKKIGAPVGLSERLSIIRLSFGVEVLRFTVDVHRDGSFRIVQDGIPEEPSLSEVVGDNDGAPSSVIERLRVEESDRLASEATRVKENYYG